MWFIPKSIQVQTGMCQFMRSAKLPIPSQEIPIPTEASIRSQNRNTYSFLRDICDNMGVRDQFNIKVKKLLHFIYNEGYLCIAYLLDKTINERSSDYYRSSHTFVWGLDVFRDRYPKQFPIRQRLASKRPPPSTFTQMQSFESFIKKDREAWYARIGQSLMSSRAPTEAQIKAPKTFSARAFGANSLDRDYLWEFNNSLRANADDTIYPTHINNRFIECIMGLPIGWTSPFHKQVWVVSSYVKQKDIKTKIKDADNLALWATPSVFSSTAQMSYEQHEIRRQRHLSKESPSKPQDSLQWQMQRAIRGKSDTIKGPQKGTK